MMQYLLIHGLGQDSSSWDKVISYMGVKEKITCTELSLLLREGDITYSNLYKSFAQYCDNFSEPLNLCGLSLGGVLALNYAIENPLKVKSLVLIGAQCEMPKALLKLQNVIFRFIPKKSFKDMGIGKEEFIKLTNSMVDLNFSENLKNILCNTLVICGEKDKVNKRATNNIGEGILKSEIKFVKNAGHEVNIDAPEELAKIMNSFYYKQQLNNINY